MKKHLLSGTAALFLTACFALSFASQAEEILQDTPFPPNPAVRLFQNNIIFYESFDHGTFEPDVGKTKGAGPGAEIGPSGLFGDCLTCGQVRFPVGSAVPTDISGTIIMWVKFRGGMPPKQKMEPPFTFFCMELGPKGAAGPRTLGCKGAGSNYWGLENMLFMALLPSLDGKKLEPVSISPFMGSTVLQDWTPDKWKLFVFTWTAQTIGISLDGCRLNEHDIKQPLATPEHIALSFHAGAAEGEKGLQFSVDECMVLNKRVSNAELEQLYTLTMEKYKSLSASDTVGKGKK